MPQQPKILINHVGYEPTAPKKIIVESQTPVSDFELMTPQNNIVYRGRLDKRGQVDQWKDWQFWQGDFSAVMTPGRYRIGVPTASGVVLSTDFEIQPHLLADRCLTDLLFYFKGQRCSGEIDRVDRSIPFVGERSERVDVHGGWYDASGDTSKYLSHLSYANFMNPQQIPMVVWHMTQSLAWVQNSASGRLRSLAPRLIEEALFGADFLIRMLDSAGYFYMTVFDKWSKDLTQREICAYETQQGHKKEDYQAGYRQGGGVAIAALARVSTLNMTGDYAPSDYLAAAERAFAHLEEHNLAYLNDGQENIIDDYCALLAATELYQATEKVGYRQSAERRVQNLINRLSSDDEYRDWWRADEHGERPYFHAAEAGLPVIALLRYAEVTQDETVLETVQRSLTFELELTQAVTNPFGYARQYVKGVGESKRGAFFIPHQNESGYWWQGENARLASLATAALWAAKVVEKPTSTELRAYAYDQLNWILGLNPYSACMMHGRGHNNPDYLDVYPNAPGGICNGITAGFENEHDIDFMPEPQVRDLMQNWRWGEQWIPHGGWLMVALAALPS